MSEKKYKPFKNLILIEKKEAEKMTDSGLFIPNAEERAEDFNLGTVIDVGDEVKSVKKGNEVFFKRYGAEVVEINKKQYVLIQEEDILMIGK